MTVLVDDVLAKAGIVANDVKAIHWTTDEQLLWLTEGARRLCVNRRDANVSRETRLLVAGARQTLPTSAIALLDVRTPSGPVRACDKAALDAFNPAWQDKPKSVVTNYMHSSDEHPVFWVYPAQSSTPATIELVYSAYPEPATVGGEMSVLKKYEDNLVNYLLYRMFSKDAETGSAERASVYLQLFNS